MTKYVIVEWPDIQEYMDKPGFDKFSHLINDDAGVEEYGSSAYFVAEDWLRTVNNKPIWHDSNEEQPDYKNNVLVVTANDKYYVEKYVRIHPNCKWAYIKDLL